MAHAYTPGLQVTYKTTITRERLLPLKGEVVASSNARVTSEQVVARTELPGAVKTVNVVNLLSIQATELADNMLKKVGDDIREGEVIAKSKPLFGLKIFDFLSTYVNSPITGKIEKISDITGQVILREPPLPVEVKAYVDGIVVGIKDKEGVTVETTATFIQGIFGIGGETNGKLKVIVKDPSSAAHPSDITKDLADCIIVVGSECTAAVFQKAVEMKVRGIITGGFNDKDLKDLLGYELGVAITGNEQLGLTLVVTEGFGKLPIAEKTFNLLKQREGSLASISGATQIRAGVIRPEVVIPFPDEIGKKIAHETAIERGGTQSGSLVRIIREPYFGRIGTVEDLPHELVRVESETLVRVMKIKFNDTGESAIIPRANIEMIED